MAAPAGSGSFQFRRQYASGNSPSGGSQISTSGSRDSSTSIRLYYDGSLAYTTVTLDTGSVPTTSYISGGFWLGTKTEQLSGFRTQTETFGGGLNDASMAILHAAALAYNRALGRQP